jgi:hypothetical protein
MSLESKTDAAATEGCAPSAGYVTGTESKCDACGGYGYREKIIFGKWRVVPCFVCKGNDQFVSRSHTQ